jgi:cytochrome c5
MTVLAILMVAATPSHTQTQPPARSGKSVVDTVCASCHATGAGGAPRIGDVAAWRARVEQGLTALTSHALQGLRSMPPHRGHAGLSDFEVARAVVYMVNQSGGSWAEPVDPAAPAAERSGEQVVRMQCVKCHEGGMGGAPRIGDRAAWTPRLKYGLDATVRSAVRGHGGMPARGGLAELTDTEVRSAVVYMFNPSPLFAPAHRDPAQAARPDPNHRLVDGLEVFVGVVPAGVLRAEQHAGAHVQSWMHGGIPEGEDVVHVNVTLYEAATRRELREAEIQARVESRAGATTVPLQIMPAPSTTSYGNYIRLPPRTPYTLTLTIRRPGVAQPTQVRFERQP